MGLFGFQSAFTRMSAMITLFGRTDGHWHHDDMFHLIFLFALSVYDLPLCISAPSPRLDKTSGFPRAIADQLGPIPRFLEWLEAQVIFFNRHAFKLILIYISQLLYLIIMYFNRVPSWTVN